MSVTVSNGEDRAGRLVWDLPLRLTHWALVVTVAGAWITHYAGVQWFGWHRRLGYATLVLVTFRIVWGFVGTRHARFANFVRGPAAVLAFLRARGRADTPGHSPLAALSVVAMLALLLVQALTGLFANDEIANAGPFYGWVTQQTSNRISGLHATNSNLLLGLVALHIAAIGWYVFGLGRPLLRAMLTGRKDPREVATGDEITGSRIALALAVLAALAVALALAIHAAPEATVALF
jgi:cytochrome b